MSILFSSTGTGKYKTGNEKIHWGMCCILNELCYIWLMIHQNKKKMKDLKVGMYLLGMIGSSIGMVIHLFQMIETSEVIHLVCLLLWFIMFTCLYIILGKKLQRF